MPAAKMSKEVRFETTSYKKIWDVTVPGHLADAALKGWLERDFASTPDNCFMLARHVPRKYAKALRYALLALDPKVKAVQYQADAEGTMNIAVRNSDEDTKEEHPWWKATATTCTCRGCSGEWIRQYAKRYTQNDRVLALVPYDRGWAIPTHMLVAEYVQDAVAADDPVAYLTGIVDEYALQNANFRTAWDKASKRDADNGDEAPKPIVQAPQVADIKVATGETAPPTGAEMAAMMARLTKENAALKEQVEASTRSRSFFRRS